MNKTVKYKILFQIFTKTHDFKILTYSGLIICELIWNYWGFTNHVLAMQQPMTFTNKILNSASIAAVVIYARVIEDSHLGGAYCCVPISVLSILQILTHWILITTFWTDTIMPIYRKCNKSRTMSVPPISQVIQSVYYITNTLGQQRLVSLKARNYYEFFLGSPSPSLINCSRSWRMS